MALVRFKFTNLQSIGLTLESVFQWAKRLIEDLTQWSDKLTAYVDASDAAIVESIAEVVQPPIGSRILWYSLPPPTGWLLGDGQSLLVADYPELFALIGYAYGGAGANFNVRDDLASDGLQTIVRAL